MVKYFEVTGELCVAFFVCFLPYCLSSPVYTYLTSGDRGRLIEVEFAENGSYADCAVFGDRTIIQDVLKGVPRRDIREVGQGDVDFSTRTCHDFHMTLEDSPLRKKRAFAAIYPGTKWCGRRDIADNYDDLGVHNFTDACCREHDHCQDCVEAFKTKYGLFNWGFYARCDCSCDDKFYKCLKTANDSAAVNVGKLYFNILRSMCMKDVHPQKCIQYWWLFCRKYTEDKTKVEKKFVHSSYF